MNSKYSRYIGLVLSVFILFFIDCLQAADSPRSHSFNFKIGFEFQEANNLCGEFNAVYLSIQKQAIFKAMKDGKVLWDLTIDDNDLEFVTPPFASDVEVDLKNLEFSIESIVEACKVLQNLMQTKGAGVSFQEWVEGIKYTLTSSEEELLKHLKLKPELLKQKHVKDRYDEILARQNESRPGLKATLAKNGIQLETSHIHEVVSHQPLKFLPNWHPKFMPQVTIQHPLEYTIPLVLSLFGNKSKINADLNKIEKKLRDAIPYLSNKAKLLDSGHLNKENGLLFLHSLTCSGIQRYSSHSDNDLTNSLHIIKNNDENYAQTDPKVNLFFLSRRPFSEMWSNIKSSGGEHSASFQELYQERIIEGNPIFKADVFRNFKFVNYAEYYYTDTHKPQDLACSKLKCNTI